MRGVVRERDLNGPDLAGATVTLDDNQSAVYNGTLWDFSVAPRYVCATATLAGYQPATRCQQVAPGGEQYNSIVMFPNSDFIDASPNAPDASSLIDAGPGGPDSGNNAGSDAGMEPPGGGGCGCRAGGGSGLPGSLALSFVLLLAWRRSR
jgi:hypothetical protein